MNFKKVEIDSFTHYKKENNPKLIDFMLMVKRVRMFELANFNRTLKISA